ncbi:hypothetical protein RBH88_03235 [Aminobacterium sp. MB27-C1]|uniref:hypothetical protein n=1 Tax=Aminobacterium sp. MB27-C1 TaxID=3070661 RepID=UPI0027DCB9E2|nr:hypothetical protein [Aminobacterium sp. MB27-C1]WMI72127.1 hypothetical protein RBH88_03235 [Aminobacterium sp. MB27-C1]
MAKGSKKIVKVTYCGPSIPMLGLLHGSTFIGGVPEQIKILASDNPFLKKLFVKPEEVGAALVSISTHGTVLYSLSERAKKLSI